MSARPRPSVWAYVLCYALWLVTGALGLLDAAIARMWVREGYVRSQLDRWGFAAADEFGIVILGLIWLGAMLGLEYYYRAWLVKRKLWKRFGIVTAIELVPPLLRFVTGVLA